MVSNLRLAQIGNFELRLHHLLIIGILAISFSVSFLIRSQAADYGFELNEFDPFFNYRATEFIVENGIVEYFEWHDDRSWYPNGRDVSATSQAMLHITAASLYQVFGGDSSLYDFTIIFPVVFGSLTTIVVFALVRVLGGTTAGLFAALFFSVSVPVIVRGTIGWFKSEPLGLFFGLLAAYLFLSGIKHNNRSISFAKLIGAGILLSFGISAWGGIQFLVLPIGFFIISLAFVRNDHKFIITSILIFLGSLFLTTMIFDRPGIYFITGHNGFILLGSTAFLIVSSIIQKFSPKHKLRNTSIFLAILIIVGIVMLSSLHFEGTGFRYLNAINPFLTTADPLVDSVAEHATTTTAQSFFFLSILMVFAGIGVWLIFSNKEKVENYVLKISKDMIGFALIIGILGVYISSAFVRLELFASISIIILSSIGLSILTSEILKPSVKTKKSVKSTPLLGKISFVVVVVILLIIPTIIPVQGNWIDGVKAPPTLLNGGTNYRIINSDWPDAMEWLKNNTPQDAVVASWWDYGYWITTLGERISLADNATLSTERIQEIARILLSNPDEAWLKLNELDADYVLIFIAANKIQQDPLQVYLLTGGADESKKQWFMRIAAEEPLSKYLYNDGYSGTPYFWDKTLLGQMIPYSPLAYVHLPSNQQSEIYRPGFTAIYSEDIKYPEDGSGPLKLVYSSNSFDRETVGPITAVLIYEVNKDYTPNTESIISKTSENGELTSEKAIVTTAMGEFTIEFKNELAPNTVDNFKDLARTGFYDGTIFHRIIPGFVIQGGDPNTISGARDTWGTGGPGYSIEPEFSNEKHTKYMVSMARGSAIDSAGSQFFVVLDDAPWLDGQYTIFGEVTDGKEVIDKIAAIELDESFYVEQPKNPSDSLIEKIRIVS